MIKPENLFIKGNNLADDFMCAFEQHKGIFFEE